MPYIPALRAEHPEVDDDEPPPKRDRRRERTRPHRASQPARLAQIDEQ